MTNHPPAETTLARSLTNAWVQRAQNARRFLAAAFVAPLLVKPDAVEQARREYATAMAEADRWAGVAADQEGGAS